MAVAVSRDDFVTIVRKSKIIDPDRLDAFLQSEGLPLEASRLAEAFVAAGLLTKFHTEQLLRGRYKGFELGKYRVLEPIGSGAMGTVYLCEHKQMKHRLAVKLLPKAATEKDPTAVKRFYREAQAAGALVHPNIIRTHDIDQANGYHYITMDYVEGITLHDLVERKGPLPVEQAIHYIVQAALGMQYIYESGLVHRDLKPGNLLLDTQGTIKILDLGLALFMDHRRDNLTENGNNGTILGTADFLSPEQASHSHGVDIRADIYSLGATLYYLLAGQAPFAGLPLTHKLLAVHGQEPPSLTKFRDDLPPELLAVIGCMMAKRLDRRYQMPLEVAHALAPFLSVPIDLPPLERARRPEPPPTEVIQQGKKETKKVRPVLSPPASSARPGSSFSTSKLKPLTNHGSGYASSVPLSRPNYHAGPRWMVKINEMRDHPGIEAGLEWLRHHPRTTVGGVTVFVVMLVLSVVVFPRFSSSSAKADPGLTTNDNADTYLRVQQGFRERREADERAAAEKARQQAPKPAPAPKKPKATPPPAGKAGTHKVTRSGEAETYRTVKEALAKAKPGDTVQLLDAEHEENLVVEGALGAGVTVKAATANGASVAWTGKLGQKPRQPLVRVMGTAGFRLEGPFVFTGDDDTAALVVLQGHCPGLTLQGVELRSYYWQGVLLQGCSGTKDQPVVLDRLRVVAPTRNQWPQGIAFGKLFGASGRNQHVLVRDGRFEGKLAGAICVSADAQDVTVRGNRFFQSLDAVKFDKSETPLKVRMEVVNNTFVDADHGLYYQGVPLKDEGNTLVARQNLFVRTQAIADVNGPLPGAVPDNVKAKWIWSEASEGDRFFRKPFFLTTASYAQARLDIAGDESFTVWVNGTEVGKGKGSDNRVFSFDVLKHLKAGKNLLAVQAHGGKTAGLLAQLTCKANDGVELAAAATDDTWRCLTKTTPNWLDVNTDDSSWQDAQVTAELGKFRSELAWDALKPGDGKPAGASRHLVPVAQDNFRDAASKEGKDLNLRCREVRVPELAVKADHDATFLRYDAGHELARLGPGGSAVGSAPPRASRPAAVQAPLSTEKVLYHFDVKNQLPFVQRCNGGSSISHKEAVSFPDGWTAHAWKQDTVAEVVAEQVEGSMGLGIRNTEGRASVQLLSWPDHFIKFRSGTRYLFRVEYTTTGSAAGLIRIDDGGKLATDAKRLTPSDGRWSVAEVTKDITTASKTAIVLQNLTEGADATFYIRSLDVIEAPPTIAANPAPNSPAHARGSLYRLDLPAQKLASVRVQGQEILEQSGELPAGWTFSTWKNESTARVDVESVGTGMGLGIRNLTGPASSMLFLNDLPLKAGREYALRFQYQTRAATGIVKIKEDQADARQLDNLPRTDGQWRFKEVRVTIAADGSTRFEFFNNANSAEEALLVKDVEVVDLGS